MGLDTIPVTVRKGPFHPPASFDHRPDLKYLQWYLSDSRAMVTAPGRWKVQDWLILGGASAVTAVMVLAVDEPVNDYFRDLDSDFWKGAEKVLDPFGALTTTVYAVAVPFTYGLIFRKQEPRKLALEALEAQLLVSALSYPINWIASRTRPRDGGGPRDFNWIWNKKFEDWADIDTSFPSGHTILAFSAASVFAFEYHDKVWVPPLVYGLASMVGLERLSVNAHWASDVFFGAVVGHFMTKTLVREHQKANAAKTDGRRVMNSFKIYPFNVAGGTGIRMVYSF